MKAELIRIDLPMELASAFEKLPESIDPSEAVNRQELQKAFLKEFRCFDASKVKDVVFIWTVN